MQKSDYLSAEDFDLASEVELDDILDDDTDEEFEEDCSCDGIDDLEIYDDCIDRNRNNDIGTSNF